LTNAIDLPLQQFSAQLTADETRLLAGLDSPARIQAFLDGTPYSPDRFYRCPLRVLRERKAHCFDGALFAALALRRLGRPAMILELIPNERDDDHLLALVKEDGLWGAVAQSNFSGLRFREPVYRSLHELVLSYFEDFFNPAGEKTLRGFRGPMNLARFDRLDWMGRDDGLESLADGLDHYRIVSILPAAAAARLARVDDRSLQAGLLGSDPSGLYKPPDESAPGGDSA
jgi:hypothetical protein